MTAILAKKLGMTQRFLEDGRVERVTVLEAGPCPVLAIRTHEADGYEAVQLGFGSVREKALSKGELGHLKKADAPPLRTVKEFRNHAGELTVGDTVTVESFEVGQTIKVSGKSKGKGFAALSSATTSPPVPSPTARTTCAPRARSAPRRPRRASSRASRARAAWAAGA